jgi:hypothetical protein
LKPSTEAVRGRVAGVSGPNSVAYAGDASFGCNDTEATTNGMPSCNSPFAGRIDCGGTLTVFDAFQCEAGDRLRATFAIDIDAELPGSGDSGSFTITGNASRSVLGSGLTSVPCRACTSQEDCEEDGELCLDEFCNIPLFGD